MGIKNNIGAALIASGVIGAMTTGIYMGYCDTVGKYLDDTVRGALKYGPTIFSTISTSMGGVLIQWEGLEKLAQEGKKPPAIATPAATLIMNAMVGAAGGAAMTWVGYYQFG